MYSSSPYAPPMLSRSRPNSPHPPNRHVSPPSGPVGFPVGPHPPNFNAGGQVYYGAPAPASYDAPIGKAISRDPSPNTTYGATGQFQVQKRAKSPNPYGQPTPGMYAPAPRTPIGGGTSHIPGGGQPYPNPTTGGPNNKGPSPTPPGVAFRPPSHNSESHAFYGTSSPYGGTIGRPISRAPSPNPHSVPPAAGGFQVEKRAKSPNPYGRPPTTKPELQLYRNEILLQDQISSLIAAKDRRIAATGRIPVDPTQLSLFFKAKDGISHALDFPVDTGYTSHKALDVLISTCKDNQPRNSYYDGYQALTYPTNLNYSTSFEIFNYPIMDALRHALFSVAPSWQHLTAVKDSLDVITSGSRIATKYPAKVRQDSRLATLIITLPVQYRGGAIVVTDHDGKEEKFLGNGGKPTEIEWVAFRFEGGYAVEPVQSGCMVTISYGIYISSYGRTNPDPNAHVLITPSDQFFNLLSPIMNNSRGRNIAFLLSHDYNIDPSEAVANTIVAQLRGGDALLYDAFKLHRLSPELRWTAGGFVWPVNYIFESFGDDDANTNAHKNTSVVHSRAQAAQGDGLQAKVLSSGAVPLAEANITLLADPRNSAPSVGRERVYFVSKGELEKLVVNTLLIVFIP